MGKDKDKKKANGDFKNLSDDEKRIREEAEARNKADRETDPNKAQERFQGEKENDGNLDKNFNLDDNEIKINEAKLKLEHKDTIRATDNDEDDAPKRKPGTTQMIWPYKKEVPGEIGTVFGHEGVANEDGFFVVEIPNELVKNEMKRTKTLIPLDLYERRKKLDAEAAKLYEDED